MPEKNTTTNPFFSRLLEHHYVHLRRLAKAVARKFPTVDESDLAHEAAISLLRSPTPKNNLSDSTEREKFFKRVLRNKAITLSDANNSISHHTPVLDENNLRKKNIEPATPRKMNILEFREAMERLSPENQKVLSLYFKHHTAAAVGRELFPHLSPQSQKALGFKAVKRAAGAFVGMPADVARTSPMRAGKSHNPRNTRKRNRSKKA